MHHKYMSSAEWMTNSSSECNGGLLRQTSLRCKCALDLIACVPLCGVGTQYVQSWYGSGRLFIIQSRFYEKKKYIKKIQTNQPPSVDWVTECLLFKEFSVNWNAASQGVHAWWPFLIESLSAVSRKWKSEHKTHPFYLECKETKHTKEQSAIKANDKEKPQTTTKNTRTQSGQTSWGLWCVLKFEKSVLQNILKNPHCICRLMVFNSFLRHRGNLTHKSPSLLVKFCHKLAVFCPLRR